MNEGIHFQRLNQPKTQNEERMVDDNETTAAGEFNITLISSLNKTGL